MNRVNLTDNEHHILDHVHIYVADKLVHDRSGHDIAHIERVVKLAKYIAKSEPTANMFIVLMSAYLHDVIDDKVVENSQLARQALLDFLQKEQVNSHVQHAIMSIIDNMSYSKNLEIKQHLSLEGKIVQDADRLDALGAIGIGRTFYYGGNKKNQMHDPKQEPRTDMTEADYRLPGTVINHFYEKLFLLKDQMNTDTAKKLADERHQFLVEFITRFENEWMGVED